MRRRTWTWRGFVTGPYRWSGGQAWMASAMRLVALMRLAMISASM